MAQLYKTTGTIAVLTLSVFGWEWSQRNGAAEIKTRNSFSIQGRLGGYRNMSRAYNEGRRNLGSHRESAKDRDYLLHPPFGSLLWSIRKMPLSGNSKMITVSKSVENAQIRQKITCYSKRLNFMDEHSLYISNSTTF